MTAIANEDYRIEKRPGGFAVYQVKPRTVRIVQGDGAGGIVVNPEASYSKTFHCADPSIFFAYWDKGSEDWFVDIDCGAQRWQGHKEEKDVRAALKRCGFKKREIDQTLAEAKS